MQYDVETPDDYVAQLADDWRRPTLLAIRDLIREAAPELAECIRYKMLAYADGGEPVFCLNAQKQYVSLYVGNAGKVDADGQLLAGLNVGKGCIRFGKSVDVSATRIDEFIARAVHMWRAGEDFDC